MLSIYDGPYVEGVPNPYVPQIEIYPSYEHGADYTRPVFSMPFLRNPYNVISGLGADEGASYLGDKGWDRTVDEVAIMKGSVLGCVALAAVGGFIGGVASPAKRNAGTGILLGAIAGALTGLIPAAIGAAVAVATVRKNPKP